MSYVFSDYSSGWNSYHTDYMNDILLLYGMSYVFSDYSSGWNSYHTDYMNDFSLQCGLTNALSAHFSSRNSYYTYITTWIIFSFVCFQSTYKLTILVTILTTFITEIYNLSYVSTDVCIKGFFIFDMIIPMLLLIISAKAAVLIIFLDESPSH